MDRPDIACAASADFGARSYEIVLSLGRSSTVEECLARCSP